mmetsp:Transcript_9305/g.39503  ORF Transcript_9305/g.39503 Transcript_9305/m.39503 type:complete len:267 (+) Transcript_9305:2007-2807(+)
MSTYSLSASLQSPALPSVAMSACLVARLCGTFAYNISSHVARAALTAESESPAAAAAAHVPSTLPNVYTSGSSGVLSLTSASSARATATPPDAFKEALDALLLVEPYIEPATYSSPEVSSNVSAPSPPAARISRLYVLSGTSTPAARAASKASNAKRGRFARAAASMSSANVRALGATRPSSAMRWKISNACSTRGCGAVAHASSNELYVVLRGANPSARIAAKTSNATSTSPPAEIAANAVSYVSRLGETPVAVISSNVRATRSG